MTQTCNKIAKEEKQWLIDTFKEAVNQEKQWAEYLFKDGSMIGLNEKLLSQYVEWIANRRMKAIGLDPIYDIAAKKQPSALDPTLDLFQGSAGSTSRD